MGDLFQDKYQSADKTDQPNVIRPQMTYQDDAGAMVKKGLIIAAAIIGGLILLGVIKGCVSGLAASDLSKTEASAATATDTATAEYAADDADTSGDYSAEAEPVQDTAAEQPDMAQEPFAPSFDCSRAASGQERLVCNDRELSALDVSLHQIYIVRRDEAVDSSEVLDSQRNWIRNVFRGCSDKACLVQAYSQRLSELSE